MPKSEIKESKQIASGSIFQDLKTFDADHPPVTTIESLCMNCGKNGLTRLLLTKIPHYKDIILMSFQCENCGFENNEIQNGGKINEKGIRIKLEVVNERDLNRQVVKSDYTSIKIPKLNFEIPSQSQKGEITTIEGIIDRSVMGLEQDQSRRKQENPKTAADIELFISQLLSLKSVDEPFTIIFEDITGETHVENVNEFQRDRQCSITHFVRSEMENKMLGIFQENNDELLKPMEPESYTLEDLEGEILKFPTNCPKCNAPCSTNMKMTNIPHFKEVVIMATTCDECGHKTNEVKSGSGIEPEGIRIQVQVTGTEDFSRDVLKSETCSMEIPELELEVGPNALGGRFTTIEGLLTATKEQLLSSASFCGDSVDETVKKRMDEFISKLDQVLNGIHSITIILDDPAGNSYIQSLSDNGCDGKLTITKYQRTFQQNEELGINDMKVENYDTN
ncbi:zinc finger protein ZPR1 [Fopius arisanus]|uniref:Zinc finger protein ZPR1 n=1 Tax=Fopius arisanus TaxID=64838 RepID=A0A9R1TCA0_9HYME|nr:PREDICTED: zinc finger protein ZPR1 [Fopius arisanus]